MCYRPQIFPNSGGIPAPCGKCPKCLQRRMTQWMLRLRMQEKSAISAYFTTLTYDPQNVPKGYTLVKKDVQDFFKRLRYYHVAVHGNNTIRYYACGEYGSKHGRPHYHAIIYNADDRLIDRSWGKGDVLNASVTGASIAYVLKYMTKPRKIPRKGRIREFSLMSKGMGKAYLTPAVIKWHREHPDNCYARLDGHKVALPRYYKDRIYTDEEREHIAWHQVQRIRKEEEEARARDPAYDYNKQQSINQAYKDMYAKSKQKRDAF